MSHPSATETRLYGTRKGEEDWQEEIITTDGSKIEEARKWAEENGFDRFRVATFTPGEKPDFARTLNP